MTAAEADINVEALVVNRVHPHFGTNELRSLAQGPLAPFVTVLHESQQVAAGEQNVLETLTRTLTNGAVVNVPFLDTDVHDLESLGRLSRWLTPT